MDSRYPWVMRGAHGRAASLLLALAAAACGSETAHPGVDAGVGGSAGNGGAAGGADGGQAGCLVGERPLEDGGCQPPGVPPERCAEGFVPDGLGGCDPVLPDEPCAPGTMAIPGETVCRELADCGAAPWGNIPIDGEVVQFVDGSYVGGDSDGTAERPWSTIQQGIDVAETGGLVAVAEGSYPEQLVIVSHAVRLWGRCPALVEVTGEDVFSVDVGSETEGSPEAGTEVHTIAISGAGLGIVASDALDVLVDRVWVHDTGDVGLLLADAWGPASVLVSGSLFEANTGAGMLGASASLVIDESVIRDAVVGAGADGRGISVERFSAEGASLALHRSVLERNHAGGLFLGGADAAIDATVIRDTRPATEGSFGLGIDIVRSSTIPSVGSSVEVHRSVISGNRLIGIIAEGSEVLIEDSVVRDTDADPASNATGAGIIAQLATATGARASLTLRQSLIDRNHDVGFGLVSSDALLESVLVRGTQPVPLDGTRGLGMILSYHPELSPEEQASRATIRWSRVEDNRVVGISVVGGALQAESLHVLTTSSLDDGRFGDGVVVLGGPLPASLSLQGSAVESNARAGVANFGAAAAIADTRFDCNAIDLDGEIFITPFSFEDLGGNQCGCGAEPAPCQVASSSLEPPTFGTP